MSELAARTKGFRLVPVPAIPHDSGTLGVLETDAQVPFPPRRAFFVTHLMEGAMRGGHAHHQCHQLLVCLHGSIRFTADDGTHRCTQRLDSPQSGLYLPPLTWLEYVAVVPDSICLVLASDPYDEDDYIRDLEQFYLAARRPVESQSC